MNIAKFIMVVAAGPGDTTAPTVAITSTETSGSYVLPIPITITFSEQVTGFAVGDITISGGSLAGFATADNIVFTVNWTPANGANTMDIAAGVCTDLAGNLNLAATQFPFTSIQFTLRDDFTDTQAAGAVNGTNATPTGGARVNVDTNTKVSIGSGVLNYATGAAANDNTWWGSQARTAGKVLISDFTTGNNTGNAIMGWDSGQAGALSFLCGFSSSASLFASGISGAGGLGAYAASTNYRLAAIIRTTGYMVLIKGGAFTNWTLLYPINTGTTDPAYPAVGPIGTTSPFTSSFNRIPTTLQVLTPLASDAFTRANGVLGNTGGGGSEESGGSGVAWAAQLGTWGIATNKAASSALDGTANISIATVPCGTTNVMVEVVATRSSGTSGLCLRYTDANNYIKAVHNGTNLQVTEVVNGTPNTLVNAAATYGAAFRLIVSLKGDKLRAYYNNVIIGGEVTTAVTTGNNHGLFTDDTGATFDNFVVWAKGNGGEYDTLFDKYTNP